MMLFNHTTFIGVDPTAGQKPFVYAALDHDLRLLAIGKGSMDDILAFIAGQREAYVGVNGPRRPNQGVMEKPEVRASLSPQPRPGRWRDFRLAEYQMRQHNISCPKTGARPEGCPHWMQMTFSLYERMESFGFCPFPAPDAPLQWLEVYPHACFTALLDLTPFPKNTLEGRIQRQLILYEKELRIPDPMRLFEEITRHRLLQGKLPMQDLYTPAELDALAAAYTAYCAAVYPQEVTLLGDPIEGQVSIPVSSLKQRY